MCPLFEKPSRPPTPLFAVEFYRYSPSSHCNSSLRSYEWAADFGGAGARADKGKTNFGAHRASQRAGAEKLAQPGKRQQPSALAGLEFAALSAELQKKKRVPYTPLRLAETSVRDNVSFTKAIRDFKGAAESCE